MKSKNILKEHTILKVIYLFVFLFVVFNEAIYSPDTRSYIHALPYRHLGYVLFVKIFNLIFSDFFDLSILVFQGAFSLTAVHVFFKKAASTLHLNTISKIGVLAILLFPFFKPLSVANNICPEGISYGLYLLFVAYSIELLCHENRKTWMYVIGFYLALTFTRGQFILTPLIIAFVYLIKHKKQLPKLSILIKSIVLVCIPIIVVLTESTYHKLKDGIFMTTPFGFVAASGSAFYVSERQDINHITDENDRKIFELCYDKLAQEKLLLTSQNNLQSYAEYYAFFHDNVPPICNHTIHDLGKDYYYQKEIKTHDNINYAHARAYHEIEKTCKNLTFTLIKANFKKWVQLYFANLSHGFYSSFFFILVVLIFIFSAIKFIFNSQNKNYTLLFMFSALTLSNAMLIAFASHSILRYLFYNYALLFLIFIILIKQPKHGIKN